MPEHSLKHLMNVILFLLSVLMQVKHLAVLARTMGRASRAAPASHTLILLHLPADLKYLCWVLLLSCCQLCPTRILAVAECWLSLASAASDGCRTPSLWHRHCASHLALGLKAEFQSSRIWVRFPCLAPILGISMAIFTEEDGRGTRADTSCVSQNQSITEGFGLGEALKTTYSNPSAVDGDTFH